jgi:3-oxoacyl-[acyl-carrier protein] reductase
MSKRNAFVTGASRGIGRACALALSQAGCRVVLAARQRDRLEAVAQEIHAAGGQALVVEMDLSSPDSIAQAFAAARVAEGGIFAPIHILVNNAAVTRDTLALRMKREDFETVIQTNLTGAFLCVKEVLQGMMKERWGRIVNLSSVVGQSGNAGQANYAASKAGLIGLTKSLAQEMASRNVTVNAVAPGFIDTDMTAVLPEAVKTATLDKIPLKRFGTPEDIAAAVAFLASDQASYITGHTLDVNGGMYM